MTKAFVSYSRRDTEFTRTLTDALIAQQYELWVDWESIPPTVDWKLQIQKGVEEADTFLFLISPDSVKSRECLNELTLAVTNGKRLIPLVVRQIDPQDSPNELKHINWIFFNKPEEFDKSFQKLLDAISTDYDWVQTHRRLQVKALEWDRAEREHSFLLRGRDLEYAEGQLVVNASKDPKPTDLQREFILKSRSAAARQRRTTTAVLIGVAIAMLFLAVAAFIQRQNAIANAKVADKNAQDAMAARAEAQLNEKVAEANAAEAQKNALIAQVGEVSSFALGKLDQDYNESLLYSVEAYRLAEKSGFNIERAKSAMLGTLQNQFGLAKVLPVHADWINSIAYSQDGSSMVSASADVISYLWDVSNPLNPVRLYQLDGDDIAISRDKKMLAASQYDEEFKPVIKLWNITDISKPATVSEFDGNFVLDFLPDGKSLIIQHKDEGRFFAENWNISDPSRPRLVSTLEGTSAALSPDGSILALSNADEQGQTVITLWNIVTPAAPVTLSTISGRFEVYVGGFDLRQTFTFSPDNKMLAIAGFDASDKAIVELWDVSNPSVPTQASSFASNADWINSLAFSPDGELLAIGNNNGRIAMWDVSDPLNPSWNPSSNTLTGHSLAVNSMTFAPDGKTLATGSYDGTIMLWDMSGLSNPLLIRAPYGTPLALNANGDTLVTAHFDEALQTESTLIWDVSTPSAPVQTLELGMKSDLAAISSDNKLIVTSTYAEQEDADVNILWDISDPSNPVEHRFVSADRIYDLKFSPHDTALLVTTDDNTKTKKIYISTVWDISAGKEPTRFERLSGNDIVFSPDGTTVAVSTGTDPDGTTVAVSTGTDADTHIQLWDVSNASSRKPIGSTLEGSNPIFSVNGKLLATTVNDSRENTFTVILWNISDPANPTRVPVEGHTKLITSLAFSPDGTVLASAGFDKTIILWDISDPAKPVKGITLNGHSDWINAIAFSPDGSILASGGDDHNVILWRVTSYNNAVQYGVILGGIGYYVDNLEFASDTRLISKDVMANSTTLWDIDPNSWMEKACNIAGSNFTFEKWDQLFPDDPYRMTCKNIAPEPLVSVEGEITTVDVGSTLPFCSQEAGGGASCPLLALELRDQFCVDAISYTLYAVPQGSTLTAAIPAYKCNPEGVFSGAQLFSCYGPPTPGFQAQVCNTGCITPQSDQCTDGYGLDSTGSCCMPVQPAGNNGCMEVTLSITACSLLE